MAVHTTSFQHRQTNRVYLKSYTVKATGHLGCTISHYCPPILMHSQASAHSCPSAHDVITRAIHPCTPSIEYKVRSSRVCQSVKVSRSTSRNNGDSLHTSTRTGGGQHATTYGMFELGYPVNECVYMRCMVICRRWMHNNQNRNETCKYGSHYLQGFQVPSVRRECDISRPSSPLSLRISTYCISPRHPSDRASSR